MEELMDSKVWLAWDYPRPYADGIEDLRGWIDSALGIKLGLRFFMSSGHQGVRRFTAQDCNVFLDLKFHDTPNTVADAVAEAAKLWVHTLDVHVAGGFAMMKKARGVLGNDLGRARILGVTMLTSFNVTDLVAMGYPSDISMSSTVASLSRMAQDAGLDGVVASVHEAPAIRKVCGNDFLIVTPGIRPEFYKTPDPEFEDQKRVATPSQAISAGVNELVIGKPIFQAPENIGGPKNALRLINDEVETGWSVRRTR
jgi:orotidine-5'-phosphate decarboxylase